jgi:hypothetical protein
MGNTISTFQTSFFFATLYLAPNSSFRYLTLGLILVSLAMYQASPTKRLARL